MIVVYETIQGRCNMCEGFACRVRAGRHNPGSTRRRDGFSSCGVANRSCCGVRSMCIARNSTPCYKSDATRLLLKRRFKRVLCWSSMPRNIIADRLSSYAAAKPGSRCLRT